MRNPWFARLLHCTAIVIAVISAACDDPLAPLPASSENVVDTVRLFALRGTGIGDPSAYDITTGSPTRTDRLAGFDFAFDIDGAGQAFVYPAGALGLQAASGPSGLLSQNQAFDDVEQAPLDGYNTTDPLAVSPSLVFVARSRPASVGCGFVGSLPRYGKFRILSIDPVTRTLELEGLVNLNCGYRSLKPGLPTL